MGTRRRPSCFDPGRQQRAAGLGVPAARGPCQRWFLRGFTMLSMPLSCFAFLSARFSRIDLPTFLAAEPLGDFPDIGITPFLACDTRHPTPFYLFIQPSQNRPTQPPPPALRRGLVIFGAEYKNIKLMILLIWAWRRNFRNCRRKTTHSTPEFSELRGQLFTVAEPSPGRGRTK